MRLQTRESIRKTDEKREVDEAAIACSGGAEWLVDGGDFAKVVVVRCNRRGGLEVDLRCGRG